MIYNNNRYLLLKPILTTHGYAPMLSYPSPCTWEVPHLCPSTIFPGVKLGDSLTWGQHTKPDPW